VFGEGKAPPESGLYLTTTRPDVLNK